MTGCLLGSMYDIRLSLQSNICAGYEDVFKNDE